MENSFVLHSNVISLPQKIVAGSGITAILEDGTHIIDACSGLGVSCLGYTNAEISQATYEQLQTLAYAPASAFSNEPCEQLAENLLKEKPGGLSNAVFFNSGKQRRSKIVSRRHSYHGNTLGALAISGHEEKRAMYNDWLSDHVSFVEPCFAYRGKPADMSEREYVDSLIKQIEEEFNRLGPENVAAFIAETVSGSTLGCVPASVGYFSAVRALCDEYGVLLVLDEVFCGMGRTGTRHAWQQEDKFRGPDLQIISKGLGAGFIPISAVLVHEKIVKGIADTSRAVIHSQTFQCHPLACRVALKVQTIVERDRLLQNVQERGRELGCLLRAQVLPLKLVGDVRGRGLLWSVEFVLNKQTKQQFPENVHFSKAVMQASLSRGLYVHGRTSRDGGLYTVQHVMVCPPFIVSQNEVIAIVERLKSAIEACIEHAV
ncbi:pyridoxal phosphate-dependent transferase [Lophiotrema nucula]|uniref:Pyridoxal phosphate-dependent transferase n=1 Tax=Lophiotrema nucula TaxID=690887 RepID=A0A6A5YI43_9PLEO|nr:pyridoxal phosphate-dependent transferase [Lophiotrema nucula]